MSRVVCARVGHVEEALCRTMINQWLLHLRSRPCLLPNGEHILLLTGAAIQDGFGIAFYHFIFVWAVLLPDLGFRKRDLTSLLKPSCVVATVHVRRFLSLRNPYITLYIVTHRSRPLKNRQTRHGRTVPLLVVPICRNNILRHVTPSRLKSRKIFTAWML